MSDNSTNEQEITTPPKSETSNRRNFLKAGVAVTALAGAVGWGAKEIRVIENGLVTDQATFYPLYEKHTTGIDAEDIPENIDAIFREAVMSKENFEDDSRYLITEEYALPNGDSYDIVESFKYRAINKLAKNRVKIIYGDVGATPEEREMRKTKDKLRLNAGILIGGSGILYKSVADALDQWKERNPTPAQINRRKFLNKLGLGLGAVAVVPAVRSIPAAIIDSMGFSIDRKNAIQRIGSRLEGMISHLAPEDHVVFFRNLTMADKMFTVANQLGQETGSKPRIAYNIGSAHSGIEDFLIAGQEFCQWAILQYPTEVLRTMVDYVGGIDNFVSSRVLSLPPDLNVNYQKNLLQLEEFEPGKKKFVSLVKEQRIVDTKLAVGLRTKLGQ